MGIFQVEAVQLGLNAVSVPTSGSSSRVFFKTLTCLVCLLLKNFFELLQRGISYQYSPMFSM